MCKIGGTADVIQKYNIDGREALCFLAFLTTRRILQNGLYSGQEENPPVGIGINSTETPSIHVVKT